jgi:hypothetical protein
MYVLQLNLEGETSISMGLLQGLTSEFNLIFDISFLRLDYP